MFNWYTSFIWKGSYIKMPKVLNAKSKSWQVLTILSAEVPVTGASAIALDGMPGRCVER